ncbi:340_t:CDS:1, partial [Cetraspora pellucida]
MVLLVDKTEVVIIVPLVCESVVVVVTCSLVRLIEELSDGVDGLDIMKVGFF